MSAFSLNSLNTTKNLEYQEGESGFGLEAFGGSGTVSVNANANPLGGCVLVLFGNPVGQASSLTAQVSGGPATPLVQGTNEVPVTAQSACSPAG